MFQSRNGDHLDSGFLTISYLVTKSRKKRRIVLEIVNTPFVSSQKHGIYTEQITASSMGLLMILSGSLKPGK